MVLLMCRDLGQTPAWQFNQSPLHPDRRNATFWECVTAWLELGAGKRSKYFSARCGRFDVAPMAAHAGQAPFHESIADEEIMVYLDMLQWPAMLVTVLAAWLIGSLDPKRRMIGFVCFTLSNGLWAIWGWHAHAYALIVLQFCLCCMNLRGFGKNAKDRKTASSKPER